MKGEDLVAAVDRAANKLAKWRAHFAGWQLGTRSIDDPEAQAVRDHREVTILMRAEMNALTAVLAESPEFLNKFRNQLLVEFKHLESAYEAKFPGARATDIGMSYSREAIPWMSKWRK